MSERPRYQEEFVHKVRKLSTSLINYKQTRDEAKLYYEEIMRVKEEVLTEGRNLGLSDEMVIGMVYDMTKNQLSEWYVRKLFSGDLNSNRRKLPKNSEDMDTESKKDSVQPFNDVNVPVDENITYSSNILAPASQDRDLPPEELEVTFDLKHASHMGLKDAIGECDKSNTESYLIKIRVKDLLVKRIENEITGFVREDLTI
jgi:hypothetical protein